MGSFQNIWARYGAVGFISAAAHEMDEVDTLCYIVPEVKPFLRQPIVNIDDQVPTYIGKNKLINMDIHPSWNIMIKQNYNSLNLVD